MLADINLSDVDFWNRPPEERERAFALLRGQPHPLFFAEPDFTDLGLTPGPGYYALVRHADVLEVSRRSDIFCSGWGGATNIIDIPDEFSEFFGSMINMDNPRHARLRRVVSRAFTPRMVARLEADIQRPAAQIVDQMIAVRADRECDFVTEVAARLPLHTICTMMGVPEKQHNFVLKRSNQILGIFDPEYTPDPKAGAAQMLTAAGELVELVREILSEQDPARSDDLVSLLARANVDGEHLTDQEIGSFFVLLAVAGNETTRSAISHGLVLLTENPEQRARWMADFESYAPTAVEEIVRLSSPVIFMRRRATRDCEMNGHAYQRGDKVLLFYWSANRDESVFRDPYQFDIARAPNPHLGYGGPGPHHCLGAHLARTQIKAIFRELFARTEDLHALGQPDRLAGSSFINGIKHLRCRFNIKGG